MRNIIIVLASLFIFSFEKQNSRIEFYKGTYDNLLREARKSNRYVFLEFTAEWCAGCKKMESETFTDPQLVKYMNQNFISYSIDVESFDGFQIAERYNVRAYPSYLILDPRAKQIVRLKGFYPPKYFAGEINKAFRNRGIPERYIAADFAAY